MALTFLVVALFVLLFAGAPVAVALGLPSVAYLVLEGFPLEVLPQRMFSGMNVFVLLAIPLFIAAGEVLNVGGMTHRLADFAGAIVGRTRGGLAAVNVGTSMMFAGISGSAAADASAVGSVMIPMMDDDGYPRPFSVAVTAASAIIGPIIPPSIVFIMYGVLSGTSIVELFTAGLVPGILLGTTQIAVILLVSRRKGYAPGQPTSLRRLVRSGRRAALAVGLPAVVLGGLLLGVFTATESAAVAVFYGLIVAGVVYRTLTLRATGQLSVRVGRTVGDIMLIIAASNVLAWILVRENVPVRLADFLTSVTTNALVLLLLINVIVLITGMFLDTFPALIILTPVLLPVATTLGIDPLHLGVVLVVNLMIGAITPPIGIVLFVASAVGRTKVQEVIPRLALLFVASLAVLVLVTAVPSISMALPNALR